MERRTLTVRETYVLQRCALGDTYPQIGRQLGISASTAGSHGAHAMAKLGARSIAHAVHIAYAEGLISRDGCGCYTTYTWHIRRGEEPDPLCKAANAEQRRRERRRSSS